MFIGYRLGHCHRCGPGPAFVCNRSGPFLPVYQYKEIALLKAVLKGIGAVVGLIASVVYSMSRQLLKEYESTALPIAFLCLAVFKLDPNGLIVAAGIPGLLMSRGERSNGNP